MSRLEKETGGSIYLKRAKIRSKETIFGKDARSIRRKNGVDANKLKPSRIIKTDGIVKTSDVT